MHLQTGLEAAVLADVRAIPDSVASVVHLQRIVEVAILVDIWAVFDGVPCVHLQTSLEVALPADM